MSRKEQNASRRGFTLLELAITAGIGAVVVLAIASFAGAQARFSSYTSETLDLTQTARIAIDRIIPEIRLAGSGVGYAEDGRFAGIEIGAFTRGQARFRSQNEPLQLASGLTSTDDIGIVTADGDHATIAAFNLGGTGQLCRGSAIEAGERVLLRSEDGISARTVTIASIARAPTCIADDCKSGCDDFTWAADPSYVSGPDATLTSYQGGEAIGGFKRIIWFVEASDPADPGVARLRRAEEDTCRGRDTSCGEVMADHVETLQLRLYQRTAAGEWLDLTSGAITPDPAEPIRADIEIVMRSRIRAPSHQDAVQLVLEPGGCLPVSCRGDGYARRSIRASVEIRNSGRQSYRRL